MVRIFVLIVFTWKEPLLINIYDESGSVAMVINDSGRVVESNQDKAFGVKDYAFKGRPQATGYIGKEKDTESNLGDHGVRKYYLGEMFPSNLKFQCKY